MSSNGGSQIRHNTRERILSDDHNREQALGGQALAEILRFMFDASNNLDTYAGGYEVLGTGDGVEAGGGLRGTVINGLRVRPEVGTTNCFVEPGVAVLIDTSAPGVDASKAAFVTDPGVQSTGVLTLTPGSGGSVRIDVIECQRVTSVLEQDNRDIFNPSTGLFTPTLVSKIEAQRLAYRIRTGTAGAGFPGLVEGWMPLAVASVPAAATTWDQVTLWDVRPLASDRVNGPFDSPTSLPGVKRTLVWSDTTTAAGEVRVYGHVEAVYGGYHAGGKLVSDAGEYLDMANSVYRASGFSFTADGWWNLWLAFPFSLPRWVRYSGATTGQRVPAGPRGIPCLSAVGARFNGTPISTGVALPTWTGLSATTTSALLVLSGRVDSSADPLGVMADGVKLQTPAGTSTLGATTPGWKIDQTAIDSNNDFITWTLTDGVTHPANAKAVYVWCSLEASYVTLFTSAPTTESIAYCSDLFYVSDPDGVGFETVILERGDDRNQYIKEGISPNTRVWDAVVRVPLAPNFKSPSTARTFVMKWYCNINPPGVGVTITDPAQAQVIGWET